MDARHRDRCARPGRRVPGAHVHLDPAQPGRRYACCRSPRGLGLLSLAGGDRHDCRAVRRAALDNARSAALDRGRSGRLLWTARWHPSHSQRGHRGRRHAAARYDVGSRRNDQCGPDSHLQHVRRHPQERRAAQLPPIRRRFPDQEGLRLHPGPRDERAGRRPTTALYPTSARTRARTEPSAHSIRSATSAGWLSCCCPD